MPCCGSRRRGPGSPPLAPSPWVTRAWWPSASITTAIRRPRPPRARHRRGRRGSTHAFPCRPRRVTASSSTWRRDERDERELTLEPERERDDAAAAPIRVAPDDLEPATLRAVIESFVLREGTDYGL